MWLLSRAVCLAALILQSGAGPSAAQAPAGLLAISLGLRSSFKDDHEVLQHGFVLYDALYLWCGKLRQEAHRWPPAMR
jgi:hypothetical protein